MELLDILFGSPQKGVTDDSFPREQEGKFSTGKIIRTPPEKRGLASPGERGSWDGPPRRENSGVGKPSQEYDPGVVSPEASRTLVRERKDENIFAALWRDATGGGCSCFCCCDRSGLVAVCVGLCVIMSVFECECTCVHVCMRASEPVPKMKSNKEIKRKSHHNQHQSQLQLLFMKTSMTEQYW